MKRIGNSSGTNPQKRASDALMLKLIHLRKMGKITQVSVAQAIGVTQGRISQMESLKSDSSFEAVMLYAKAIGAEIIVLSHDEVNLNGHK